jgi:hypothetical protein
MTRRVGASCGRPGPGGPGSRRALFAVCALGALRALLACTSGTTLQPSGDASQEGSASDASSDTGAPEAGASGEDDAEGGDANQGDDGSGAASLSTSSIDLGAVSCGQSGSQAFTVTNGGSGTLAVSAATTGAAFSVSPASLTLSPGASGMLKITANVPGSSVAGTAVTGSLNLFTNDPANASMTVPLSATPSGATIAFAPSSPGSASFPSIEPQMAAPPISLSLINTGNAPATVSIGAPSDGEFTLSGTDDDGGVVTTTMAAGATLSEVAGFTPGPDLADSVTATAPVTVTGTTCGASVASIAFSGSAGHGQLTRWPSTLDFGPVDCGGDAPDVQYVVLANGGATNATVTSATIVGAPGFASTAAGLVIPAGLTAAFEVDAPAVPALSSTDPISATLTIFTDADTSPHVISLTEEPQGAIVAIDTSATPSFGSFGSIVLLQAASQAFSVVNTGNAPATVTLSTGASASDSGPDPSAFTISNPSFTLPAGGTQADSVLFSPTAASDTGAIAMTATGVLCAALPSPLPLSGAGIGGGPSLAPTSLAFSAPCGGAAPASQTFIFSNEGSANLNWSMGSPTGPGQAYYTVSASPPPGLLSPGQSSTVTVSATAIASPAPSMAAAPYAAQVTITTDVPFDPPHVVDLSETPLGDQLSLSVSSLRFGQFPINQSTVAQDFTVTNGANAGSPAANVLLSLTGSGAGAYAISSTAIANLAPGGGVSAPVGVTFLPTTAVPYPATVSLSTSDSLCTPLPAALQLTGTGTQGEVSVSATTLAFGTDESDASGLVNCGATGLAHTFTVSNTGNQQLHITGLSLGLGASSPYVLSGDATSLPFLLPIGGTTSITVTPQAIPPTVATPNDPTPFTDTLTLTTDAALDSPHRIALVMQARGAVIANTPLSTSWAFGTLASGLIGTFSTTITNTGNAAASIAFQGLSNPTVFGLENAPVTVAPDGVTQVVGQFSPPATNQVWTDKGTLVVTAADAFCEPLPASWNDPVISLSGSSISGSLPVTVSGTLAFPSTDCGSAAPAAQSITLTNTMNVPYEFTAQLSSGAFYTLQNPTAGDAGAGIIPGNGVVVLGVTPQTVTPGPSVVAGSAPYADNLVVAIQSQQPSGVTIPISWTLNGAMLSLPQGLGPNKDSTGNPFYAADSQSGLTLPLANAGTATASVAFGLQPPGAFSFSPAPPVPVVPGITALPRLTSASTDATCPTTTPGSVTFLYSGPVCQPIPVSQVTIQSCVGTF